MSAHALAPIADADAAVVHASCVAVAARAMLITGRSGAGKSALALAMMGFGAQLVADDRVELILENDTVLTRPPAAIAGLIEARGIGLLRADSVAPTPLAYVVDLDRVEQARLPEHRVITVLRKSVPLLWAVQSPHFAASLVQLLKAGRVDPEWPSQ